MTKDRIALLSSDIYDNVFQTLDAEHDVSGDEAGRIATAVQQTFEDSVGWEDLVG
jgi:hypothetical protein